MEELGVSNFETSPATLASYKQFLNLFTNNKNVYNHVIKQMANASNKRIYDIYKTIYDALMVVEYNQKFFQLETGSTPKTYTDYLHFRDSDLYNSLIHIKSIENEKERQSYIFSMCDDIVFYLSQYIDTDEYKAIFSSFPATSVDYIKQYVETVICFFMSYKVHLLGISTVYKLGDKYLNTIRPIDGIHIFCDFLRKEKIIIKDTMQAYSVMDKKEKMAFLDKVYLEISRWVEKNFKDDLGIREMIYGMFVDMLKQDKITDDIREVIASIVLSRTLSSTNTILDRADYKSILNMKEDSICFDKAYISYYKET